MDDSATLAVSCSSSLSCVYCVVACVLVIIILWRRSEESATAPGPSLSPAQTVGSSAGKTATAAQVKAIVQLAAGNKTTKALEDAIRKLGITRVRAPDFKAAADATGKRQAVCDAFQRLPLASDSAKAFSFSALAYCATPGTQQTVQTEWKATCDSNGCTTQLCSKTGAGTCTAGTEYEAHPGLNLVGTVQGTSPDSSATNCAMLCEGAPSQNKLCDFFEMHGNTCVMKKAEVPAQCGGKGHIKARCSDGYTDGATLYRKKGGLVDDLTKTKDVLDKYVKLNDCDSKCKLAMAFQILGIVVGGFTFGLGGWAGLGLVGVGLGVEAADIVLSMKEAKREGRRIEAIREGNVFTNLPPWYVDRYWCHKQTPTAACTPKWDEWCREGKQEPAEGDPYWEVKQPKCKRSPRV